MRVLGGIDVRILPDRGCDIGAAWSRGVVQVFVVLVETWYVTQKLKISPPYRALGLITLAAVAQAVVAYVICGEIDGAVALLVAIPAAVLTYVLALRVLSVMKVVDPGLRNRIIDKAPGRVKPVLSRLM